MFVTLAIAQEYNSPLPHPPTHLFLCQFLPFLLDDVCPRGLPESLVGNSDHRHV